MTICGLDCCKNCERFGECGGCIKCSGHPFGGSCIAAETINEQGAEAFEKLKKELVDEINGLNIPELYVTDLNLLNGFFVNLEYTLPNGSTVKYLNDNDVYLGNQIERKDSERCYGVVACKDFILICEYGCYGADPELVMFKKR